MRRTVSIDRVDHVLQIGLSEQVPARARQAAGGHASAQLFGSDFAIEVLIKSLEGGGLLLGRVLCTNAGELCEGGSVGAVLDKQLRHQLMVWPAFEAASDGAAGGARARADGGGCGSVRQLRPGRERTEP